MCLFVVIFIFISLNPFTYRVTIRVRIEQNQENVFATYDDKEIKISNEGDRHYITLSNGLIKEGKNTVNGTIKLLCSEEQYNSFKTLKPHYYYMRYESKTYNQSQGKLISIFE